jgi:hypothetical protein
VIGAESQPTISTASLPWPFNATLEPHLINIKTSKFQLTKKTIKVASFKKLLLYAIPLFVAFAGLLVVHFSETDLLTPFFTYENQKEIIEDKMGGGDGYRSVAYFVNVSMSSLLPGFRLAVAALDESGERALEQIS